MEVGDINDFLQIIQKGGGLGSVHLAMVKLERNGQPGFEQSTPVLAPNQKGIIVYSSVDIDGPVQLTAWEGGSPYHHALIAEVMGPAAAADFFRQHQVIPVKNPEVL